MIIEKLDLKEFRLLSSKRKCVCFGAGAFGIRLITIFDNWDIQSNIMAFIDNDKNKIGKEIVYENYRYPIISIYDVQKYIDNQTIIIISCTDYIRAFEQLNAFSCLKELQCISVIEVAQEQLKKSFYESKILKTDKEMIPRKIHYFWLGGEMPDLLKRNIEMWKKICPDYEIIKWDETNYDFTKNVYMCEAYKEKKWGFVPDYARLDVIYKYGGIYLDTDVELLKRPDELLKQVGFASFDSSFMVNLGAGFGSIAGNDIIKDLRDYYDNVHFCINGKINNLSCMLHTYNVLKKYGICINDEYQEVDGLNIYPMILQGTCAYTKQMKLDSNTYWLHYGTTSWLDNNINTIRKKIGQSFINEKDVLVSYFSRLY